jgi:DNA-binding NarL/FixJ family response regulator
VKRLTDREREVLHHLKDGGSNTAIAGRLGISVRTVQKHLQRIYAKLGVKGRTAAVIFAIQRNANRDSKSKP